MANANNATMATSMTTLNKVVKNARTTVSTVPMKSTATLVQPANFS